MIVVKVICFSFREENKINSNLPDLMLFRLTEIVLRGL